MFFNQANPVQKSKSLQLDALFKRYPNSRILDRHQSLIEIPLLMPDKQTQILFELSLPPNFPTGRPKLYVKSHIEPRSSRYISNEDREVRHPKLDRWGINCSLDGVIFNIMSDLMREGTIRVRENISPGMRSSSAAYGASPQSSYNQHPSSYPNGQRGRSSSSMGHPQQRPSSQAHNSTPDQEQDQIHFPPIPNTFDKLDSMTQTQLQELLDHEWKFKQFYEDLEYVKNINTLVTDTEKENLSIAKEKVAKDEKLKARVEELNQKKESLKSLHEQYQDLLAQKRKLDEKYEPRALLSKLDEIIDQSEQESDSVVDEFMQNGDVSSFTNKFLESRTQYHLRRLKRDRFAVQHIGA